MCNVEERDRLPVPQPVSSNKQVLLSFFYSIRSYKVTYEVSLKRGRSGCSKCTEFRVLHSNVESAVSDLKERR